LWTWERWKLGKRWKLGSWEAEKMEAGKMGRWGKDGRWEVWKMGKCLYEPVREWTRGQAPSFPCVLIMPFFSLLLLEPGGFMLLFHYSIIPLFLFEFRRGQANRRQNWRFPRPLSFSRMLEKQVVDFGYPCQP
jgi:hypothetical protein